MPHINYSKIIYFFLNSLIELNYIEDESEKRTGIFCFKTVLSNTDSIYTCTKYAKRIPGKETTQQATNSLNSEKICERGINRDAVFTYRLWHWLKKGCNLERSL